MFAVEIQFQDGSFETIMIRRPLATIGGDEACQVIIDDMAKLGFMLELVRDIGRTFRVRKLFSNPSQPVEESTYDANAHFEFDALSLSIYALDNDLMVRDTEPPDRAGVRILRYVTTVSQPKFPAILVLGNPQIIISLDRNQPMYIGRAKQCLLRLDTPDLSAQHARVGFENNEFWIEDLGSTNGSFVNNNQISGKVTVAPAVPIVLGRDTSIMGIVSEQQLRSIEKSALGVIRTRPQTQRRYPILLSVSEVARPARLLIPDAGQVQVGRDPSSDMWLGAPHVSRLHCTFRLQDGGAVVVTDHSTNGTVHDHGRLDRGENIAFDQTPVVFDFGSGITMALCFDEVQEQSFISSQGSKTTFNKYADTTISVGGSSGLSSGIRGGRGAFALNGEESFEKNSDPVDSTRERKPTGTFQALNVAYQRAGKEGKLVVTMVLLAAFFLFLIVVFLLMHTFG